MVTSPEGLIFHAIKNANVEKPTSGEEPWARMVRSDDEAAHLTNAVLTALHRAGFRILRSEGLDQEQ